MMVLEIPREFVLQKDELFRKLPNFGVEIEEIEKK